MKLINFLFRNLTDDQLVKYQADPDNFSVEGYKLEPGDIRVKYTLAESGLDKSLAEKYEADSQNGILVLLNVLADSGMKDEGTAREVINRVQKLRKEAKLVPSDSIRVYYRLAPVKEKTVDLDRVCKDFNEYIQNSLKSDFVNLNGGGGGAPQDRFLIQSSTDVKGEPIELFIQLLSSALNNSGHSKIFAPYQNVSLAECTRTVLLENPVGNPLQPSLDGWQPAKDQAKPCDPYLNIETVCGVAGGDAGTLKATVLLQTTSTQKPFVKKSIENFSKLLQNVSKSDFFRLPYCNLVPPFFPGGRCT